MNLHDYLRDIPDFPKPGIVFKDITPLLRHPDAFRTCIERLVALAREHEPSLIAGIESRGLLFGAPLALELGIGFIPIRKKGKLPAETSSVEFALEYGMDTLEIHNDGVDQGQRVLVVDDVLATGGTASAACELVEKVGGHVSGCLFVLELGSLNGGDQLGSRKHQSLIRTP